LFLYGPLDQMILKDRQSLMVETPLSSTIKIDDFLLKNTVTVPRRNSGMSIDTF
jgi:hypothetical protein